jgi:hypothetical protein
MSKPFRRARVRAVRPTPEALEDRKLLSKMVSGTDSKGDTWTLKLSGPGDLRVVKQPDASGNPQSLNSLSDIATIEVAGCDPQTTRLDGTVTPGPGSDGRVFFNDFEEIGGRGLREGASNGIQTIDMPGFWLGDTNPATTSTATPPPTQMNIPDGVVTLDFGGADATVGIPATSTTANTLAINLGLPQSVGTSIIVNKIISGARPNTTTPTSPLQDGVTITVSGRLNMFQANEIDGNSAFPSTGFFTSGFTSGGGGTVVVSQVDTATQVTGQIGFVRVGGNATNFAVQTNDKISNFYIGGETNNIFMLAPGGSRNIYFGKGMDNVQILTHTFENLQANRGATQSTVSADRSVGRVLIGGDAVNTTIKSGYNLKLAQEFSTQTAQTPTPAQDGGGMTVLVAGDIKDSVFAASVEPQGGVFGTNDLRIPDAHITAKLEGNINNTNATPDMPTTAFYAASVTLTHGAIIPPVVPEAPFPPTVYHHGQAGLVGHTPLATPKHTVATTKPAKTTTAKVSATAVPRRATLVNNTGQSVPQGPATKNGKATRKG